MPTNEILNSHSVSTLKKEISKTNIKGYSKMKKAEIISLMMKPEHSKRFSHIKMKDKTVIKKEPKKETPKKKEKPKAQLGESGIGKKRKRENKPIKKKVIDVAMPKKEPKKIPKITITEEEKPKQKVYSKGGKFFKPKEVKSKLPPIPKSNIKIRLPKKEEPKKEEPKKGFRPNTKEQKKELEEVEKIVKDNKNNFIISKEYNRVSSLIDKLKLYSNNKLNKTKFQYKFKKYNKYEEKSSYLTGTKEINEVEISYEIYNKDLSLYKTITENRKDKTGKFYTIKEAYPHNTIFKLKLENEKEEPKKEEPKKKEPKKKEPKKEKEKTLSQIPSNLKKLWKEFVNERVGSFLEKYQLEEYESLKNMEERFRDLEIKKKDKTLRAKEKFNIINDIGDIVEDIKENIEDEPRFDKVYKILTPRIYARVKADLKEKKKEESKN